MENDNINKEEERILERFFAESKTDLPDDGFTRRVMDSLPQTARRRNCVWSKHAGRSGCSACVSVFRHRKRH